MWSYQGSLFCAPEREKRLQGKRPLTERTFSCVVARGKEKKKNNTKNRKAAGFLGGKIDEIDLFCCETWVVKPRRKKLWAMATSGQLMGQRGQLIPGVWPGARWPRPPRGTSSRGSTCKRSCEFFHSILLRSYDSWWRWWRNRPGHWNYRIFVPFLCTFLKCNFRKKNLSALTHCLYNTERKVTNFGLPGKSECDKTLDKTDPTRQISIKNIVGRLVTFM